MRKREMKRLMAMVGKLTPGQRRELMSELSSGEHRTVATELIEGRFHGGVCCPHCSADRIVRNGSANGLQRYKCRGCGKSFNALTGTPLARIRQKEKWVAQAEVMQEGVTIKIAARRLEVAPSTAFRWRHRFLAIAKTIQAQSLIGIAEADQTYFLRSNKGQRGLSRPPRKRGGKASKRGLSKEQVPVLVSRDRSGSTANFVLPCDDKASVACALKSILAQDAILCTDGSGVLAAAAKAMGVAHRPVNLSAGIRVVAGAFHIQNVNAFDARLKGWMRRFHGVATRYLENYLGWFRALDRSANSDRDPVSLLAMAIG
jgi:transposase-like protein